MEGIAAGYFPNTVDPGNNKKKSEHHFYIIGENEQYTCYSRSYMVHLFKNFIELGLLVFVCQLYSKTLIVVKSNIVMLWLLI